MEKIKEKISSIDAIKDNSAMSLIPNTTVDKFIKDVDTVLYEQENLLIKTRNGFSINDVKKLDLRLQINKAKSFIDLERIAVIYFEHGKVYLTSGVIFSTHLGVFVRFRANNFSHIKYVCELTEFVYQNKKREYGIIADKYNVSTISVYANINEEIKKECEDVKQTLQLLEKNWSSKRLADIFSKDKYSILGVFAIGCLAGFIVKSILN